MSKIIDSLSLDEKVAIFGAIGFNSNSTFTVYCVDSDYHILRKVYECENSIKVVDYIINHDGRDWMVEKWSLVLYHDRIMPFLKSKTLKQLLSEPELDTIFGGKRDRESERRFDCEDSCIICKDTAFETAFRVTASDVDSILENEFTDAEQEKFNKRYPGIEARNEVVRNALSQSWHEDTRVSLESIISNIK